MVQLDCFLFFFSFLSLADVLFFYISTKSVLVLPFKPINIRNILNVIVNPETS